MKRSLLTALLIVLVVSGFGGFLLWQRIAAFNDAVSSASSASSALFFPLTGSDRVNVAIYGYRGEELGGGTYLADSINILSIDPSTDTTTIVPVPRDLWIAGQPELPRNGKVNEAFAVGFQNGGIQEAGHLATALLASVTGLTIEHWMAIDFAGFRGMVDTVGGVTVNNPMRVEADGAGSKVTFTLIRRPEMSAEDFARDKAAVAADLAALKTLLEKRPPKS